MIDLRSSRPCSLLLSLVLVGTAASLLAACPPCAAAQRCGDDAGTPGAGGWQKAFDAGPYSLSSVWVAAPDDVFVVGGGERGVVIHYDGERWTEMDVPDVPLLVWVHGFAPDDVIAVGLGGAAVRYDGATWTALATGVPADLWGVFGFASDDVWMVGGDPFTGPPLVVHYDGSAFTATALPQEQNSKGARSLFKVWGVGDRLFAVGQLGLIVEHDGSGWVERDAGPAADDDFVSLHGTGEDHIVAVGGRANARVAVFDGQAWTTHAPDGIDGLNGVFLHAPGKAMVAGLSGTLGVYDVATGEITLADTDTRLDLHSVWGDTAGRTVAVGGNFMPPFQGVALTRAAD